MSIRLYMDHHVRAEITAGLRRRAVDVVTAEEDGSSTFSDPDLLDRAASLGRVLFSNDEDLLTEAASRQRTGNPFAGVIYTRQLAVTIGKAIGDLELIASLRSVRS